MSDELRDAEGTGPADSGTGGGGQVAGDAPTGPGAAGSGGWVVGSDPRSWQERLVRIIAAAAALATLAYVLADVAKDVKHNGVRTDTITRTLPGIQGAAKNLDRSLQNLRKDVDAIPTDVPTATPGVPGAPGQPGRPGRVVVVTPPPRTVVVTTPGPTAPAPAPRPTCGTALFGRCLVP